MRSHSAPTGTTPSGHTNADALPSRAPPSTRRAAQASGGCRWSVPQIEVPLHPLRDCAGCLSVAGVARGIARTESGYVAISCPSVEEPAAVRRPEGRPVLESGSRPLAHVVHEHSLVVDDVEVVDPDREREIDVLAAGDLVRVVPSSELPNEIGVHDVHDGAWRGRERWQRRHLFTGFGANRDTAAGRCERGHDDAGARAMSCGLEQLVRPPL